MQLFSKYRVHKCVTDGRTDGRTDRRTAAFLSSSPLRGGEQKQGILRRWVWGGLSAVEKIKVLNGGRYEMVVNSCFEDLEGRVELKRV